MNIAIDIDDTLTDSFDYFLPYVAEFFGADPQVLKAGNISYSTLPPAWKERELDFCRAYYDRVVENTPFKADAAGALNRLRELGHRIVIITGRSTSFYTDPYKTTRRELEKGNIPYDKLICTLDKGTACLEESIGLLIDDLPANCAAANSLGIPALLFSGKGNAGVEAPFPRVNNWQEALDFIAAMTQEKGPTV